MKYLLVLPLSLLFWQCSIPMQSREAKISETELHHHIAFLASDALEGRKPGTPQSKQAADYIATHFASLGLTPLGDAGYQYFDVVTSVYLGDNNSLNSGNVQGTAGQDFTPTVFSANDSLAAPLAFAGYGFQIDQDSLKWDSYAGVDVQDKWVILLMGNPEPEAHVSKFDDFSSLRHKLLIARDHGAAGVIFVNGQKYDEADELMDLLIDRNFSRAALPVIQAKRSLVDQLLTAGSHTIADLERQLMLRLEPASFVTDQIVSISTEVLQQEVRTQNLIALLPGSDPELKDEYILVGAHYDHLGWGGKGSGSRRPDTTAIHNGADDNASGTAAVLEIAERLALQKTAPRRSVLFMCFGAEEMGLLGSKFFTAHPLIDLKSVKFMVNLDMVGRLDPVQRTLTIGGSGTAHGMDTYLAEMAEGRNFKLATTPDGYGPSDHASFYVEDIPVLFFFTGITEEYHTPADDIETINFKGEKLIADFATDLILGLASMKAPFEFQEAGPKSPPTTGKRGKVKMGIIPEFAAASTDGFLIAGVVGGGPAALAGLEKGDVMIALDGRSVKNVYDYMGRMAEIKPGQRITVEVLRGGEKHILIVQL